MFIYEGLIHFNIEENVAYFINENLEKYVFIIIGKIPNETFTELSVVRGLAHGTKIRVSGEIDYYEPTNSEALFCQQFSLL